jgi:hypothetical protein
MRNVTCRGQDNPAAGIYRTRFTGPDGGFVVIWSEGDAQVLRLETTEPVAAIDLYGNPYTIMPVDGIAEIPVTGAPVYIFTNSLKP